MTKASFQSLLRSLLTVVGTYVAGRSFFGQVIDTPLWEGIAGTFLATGMTAWGFLDKATTLEGFESLIRSAGIAAGGVAVALGWLKGQTVTELLGIGSILGPVILSKLARFKNKQVDQGKLVTDGTKLVKAGPKAAVLVFLLIGAAMAVNGQNLSFKPIPKPKPVSPYYMGLFATQVADTLIPGSNFQGLRWDGPTLMYLLPNNTVISTVGISYEHDTYQKDREKFYTDWSVSVVVGAGGYFAPKDPTAVALVGLKVSLFNKLVAVGVFYNLTTRQAQAGAGGGVALNN